MDDITAGLARDLHKAGLVIRQYQKFHTNLKKATDKALATPSVSPMAPETFKVVQIAKEDYQLLQRLKLMIKDFEIKLDG